MSIIAGIVSLTKSGIDERIKGDFLKCFKGVLTTDKGFKQTELLHLCIYQYDLNHFSSQFEKKSDSQFAYVAGDPVLRNAYSDISLDITKLIQTESALEKSLALTRGVFSGISVDIKNEIVNIYTDKLGIRPIFIYKTETAIYFSSLISILKETFTKSLSTDFEGLKETLTLSYALSNRTCFKEVTRMKPAELITIKKGCVENTIYWDWTQFKISEELDSEIAIGLNKTFQDAINIRLNKEKPATTFLSGGMDSRTVTASLRMNNIDVTSYNFQTSVCQDTIFSSLYAKNAKIHFQPKLIEKDDFYGWSRLISRELEKNEPKIVWSGDGGTALGGVFFSTSTSDACIKAGYKAGVKEFLDENKLHYSSRYFKAELACDEKYEPIERILATVKDFRVDKPKALTHFLLENNQARSLSNHFETLAQHKVELILPFFDSNFVEWIYKIPTQKLLYHRVYNEWFNLFPDYVQKTPWQTYPGHIECTVNNEDESLHSQWEMSRPSLVERLVFCKEIMANMKNKKIRTYVSFAKVSIILFLHFVGIKDASFLKRYMSVLKSNLLY